MLAVCHRTSCPKVHSIQKPSTFAAPLLRTLSCKKRQVNLPEVIAPQIDRLCCTRYSKTMASTLMLRSTAPLVGKFQYASSTRRVRAASRRVVKAMAGDSYEKTEAPARNRQGVESYQERKSEVDDVLTSPELNKDTELFGTAVGVADAMRFQGAAPELINSRAAMIGFVLAVIAFSKTGKNIYQQIGSWPQPVLGVFALIAVGTLVPILRGTERKDFGPFKADAEVVLGRLAMIGIVGLFWLPFVNGYYLYPVSF